MRLVYFSVSSNEIPNRGEACRVFGKNVGNLDVYARTPTQLDGRPEQQEVFVEKALKADVCVVALMGGVKSCPAWETGKKLADALIARYLEEHGQYPDNVGLTLWASPTMRTKGDDVSGIFRDVFP